MTPVQTIETEGGLQSFADWVQKNSRLVGIGAALVVVGALGFWFYMRSGEIKRQNAERGLTQAKQSLAAGNPALAQTDLERVASRYRGTSAGAQSAMMLAQLHYDAGRFADGVQVLDPYQTESAAGANLAAVWSLTADGYMGQNNADGAATAYQRAAEATSLPGESALYEAKSARALMVAGKLDQARAVWQRLLDDPEAVNVHSEAEIRLGELTARTAGQG
jgi:predicted negative regulator of RcsB-dependent stress response